MDTQAEKMEMKRLKSIVSFAPGHRGVEVRAPAGQCCHLDDLDLFWLCHMPCCVIPTVIPPNHLYKSLVQSTLQVKILVLPQVNLIFLKRLHSDTFLKKHPLRHLKIGFPNGSRNQRSLDVTLTTSTGARVKHIP